MLDALIVGVIAVTLQGYGMYALRHPDASMFRPTSAMHTDEDTSPTGRAIGTLASGLGVAGLIGALASRRIRTRTQCRLPSVRSEPYWMIGAPPGLDG